MNQTNPFRKWRRILLAGAALSLGAVSVTAGPAQQAEADRDTYTWHSELVDIDAVEGTITLQNRVLGYAEVEELESFTPGDQIALTWSGANDRASGIWKLRTDSRHVWSEPFTMPVEFVSTELDNRYLTFKVPLPESGSEAVQSLEPGQWVTLTSPQQPSGPSDVVVAVRGYNS